jgi:2-oxoglutarate ferredoxin oxidoreductase subunit alpha
MSTQPVAAERAAVSLTITGSGGSGAVTAGQILLAAAAAAGLYGLMTRSAGPQIRGGESAAMLRLGARPIDCMDDRFDLVAGLDWRNVTRFAEEIPLDERSLILSDPAVGAPPAPLLESGAQVHELALQAYAASVSGGRHNMVAVGTLGALLGLPLSALERGLATVLGDKGYPAIEASRACLSLGHALAPGPLPGAPALPDEPAARWNISGNEACGLGALRGGVRFVAAYPITPASEMLEWLAPRLEQVGGTLLQAEDELASVNMIIGASFGGVPALTATSGPGLSLMVEGLGLAVASETPVTVVDVMRGGPSTGIPTKSEQADLNLALYGLHGDAPHLVLAPSSIADCVFTTEWAVQLAERLQSPAIVLSDQLLGQSRAITAPADRQPTPLTRRLAAEPVGPYHRYAASDDDVSPMALPGLPRGMYTADGLEHNAQGIPTSQAAVHRAQLSKRRDKLARFAFGTAWGEVHGSGPLALITWGSSTGAVREAAARLTAHGSPARVIALRLLAPLPRDSLLQALEGATEIWVVELNHDGQLFHYLRAEDALPAPARTLARPGPLPLRPGEIVAALTPEP